jgi:hypothetical protein
LELLDLVRYTATLWKEDVTTPARDGGASVGRQAEMKADINAQAAARHVQLKQGIKGHMEACLEGLRSCGKGTTTCQIESEACPQKSKAGPKRMETVVITCEGS